MVQFSPPSDDDDDFVKPDVVAEKSAKSSGYKTRYCYGFDTSSVLSGGNDIKMYEGIGELDFELNQKVRDRYYRNVFDVQHTNYQHRLALLDKKFNIPGMYGTKRTYIDIDLENQPLYTDEYDLEFMFGPANSKLWEMACKDLESHGYLPILVSSINGTPRVLSLIHI